MKVMDWQEHLDDLVHDAEVSGDPHTIAAAEKAIRAEIARLRAALDAAKAHNADLSATLEARVQAARANALEDAASLVKEKADEWWQRPFYDDYTARDMEKLAAAIRAMIEQEDKG